MSEAPERIWAFHVRASGIELGEWVGDPSDTASGTEYVRADRIEALEREVAESHRRNEEMEREIDGLRNSYWEERKAHLAAERKVAELEAEREAWAKNALDNDDCRQMWQSRAEAAEARWPARLSEEQINAKAEQIMLTVVNEWHRQVGINEILKSKLTKRIADTVATGVFAAALRELMKGVGR